MSRVMVTWSNQDYRSNEVPFPPIGAVGTVTAPLDKYNELEVEFDEYPFPLVNESSWTVHKDMVVFLKDTDELQAELVDWRPKPDLFGAENVKVY